MPAVIDAKAPAAHLPSPTAPSERLVALDFTRGIALLGILLVNIQFFSEPTANALNPEPPPGVWNYVAHYIVAIFCESRFYPLFSMMFGMGLALQWMRTPAGSFLPMYARRLAFLGLLGLVHGILLWYGDVLFMYSTIGFFVMFAVRLSPLVLITVGGSIAAAYLVLAVGLSAIGWGGQPPATAKLPPADVQGPREMGFANMFELWKVAGPFGPGYKAAESLAFREGPFVEATIYRAAGYATIMVISAFSFWWHALAMFLIGAGLMKAGFHKPGRDGLARRCAIVGLGVGLPLSVAGALLFDPAATLRNLPAVACMILASTIMPLGYLGLAAVIARRFARAGPVRWIAATGRMGLTSYLLETVICTGLMYHWGLALFGRFDHAQQLLIALGVYAAVVGIANLWMALFSIGPAEWLWRSWTYFRPVAMVRRSTGAAPPGTVSG